MNATRHAETEAVKYVADLAREPESAGAARRLVEAALNSWGLGELSDDADLIISELVANAVRHTGANRIVVSVDHIAASRVRLGVTDGSRTVPRLGSSRVDAVSGRGLALIGALSDRWGTDRDHLGKCVWAELVSGEAITDQTATVDAVAVRRDYLAGLNATTPQQAKELCEPLTHHVEDLVRDVRALVPDTGGQRREQAEHCLRRAAETLQAAPAVRDAVARTHDLAVSARALLVLSQRSRPEQDEGQP